MLERLMGLGALIPATLLLTVSFFVLLAARKIEDNFLKSFGQLLVVLLWAGALFVSLVGVYTLVTGKCPMIRMMEKRAMMCRGMMDKKMMDKQMMDRNKMPEIQR